LSGETTADPRTAAAVRELFEEAVDLPVAERAACLAAASPAIRAEVESLLAAGASAGDFLETPVADAALAGGAISPDPTGERVGAWRIVSELGRAAWARSTSSRAPTAPTNSAPR
jgi:hypothetical protein